MLDRGGAGRNCGNMLVFLAADNPRLTDLDKAVRLYMAWESIEAEKEPLDLTPFQVNQVLQKLKAADQAVGSRIPETYCWLLAPGQKRPEPGQPFPPIEWSEDRLKGEGSLAERTSRKLENTFFTPAWPLHAQRAGGAGHVPIRLFDAQAVQLALLQDARSLACDAPCRLLTSSRKMVPPASSNLPRRVRGRRPFHIGRCSRNSMAASISLSVGAASSPIRPLRRVRSSARI